MVADSSTDSLISWTAEGDCFMVTDPPELSRKVLPVYFKHGNWQSFVRQLNMYGFHKINDLAYGGVFGDAQLWMFKHPCFRRGELRLLQGIKRRGTKHGRSASPEPAGPAAPEAVCATRPAPARPAEPAAQTQTQTPAERDPRVSDILDDPVSAAPGPPADGYMGGLRDCISALQRSNAELQRENQEMRAAIASCQGAFAGIMRN
ncbi:Flocculation suppression protein [Coemansia biformis]|uniref:Flocculation suppression protein n=1 Tax=Coemansia biformis TaxID=1286918 RepID=A0A9W7YDC6_9FUNG|nr:Flocculation suppression protein [Coemansia biformis]